jgi:magnesium transporter
MVLDVLMATCHTDEMGWEQIEDLSGLSELRAQGTLVWAEADIGEMNDKDIALIAEELGLHHLAVEDAIHLRQRPKLDVFENHAFVVTHQLDEHDGQLEAIQIASFVGDHYVLTLHAGAQRSLSEARQRWSLTAKEIRNEPATLLYILFDAIVDDYQRLADQLETEVEDLEELTLDIIEVPTHPKGLSREDNASIQRRLYAIKQRLARLRRYALPSERVLASLTETPLSSLVSAEVIPLLRDVHDHVLRIEEQIHNVDELTEAILELRRSEQAAALNEVTKKLTGWAAIIAVPTLISGVYGMNFALVPKEGEIFGFWLALALITISVAALYVNFKRKGWI